MTLTFLGTGTSQGVPVIACTCQVCRSVDFKDKRLRSSVHIEWEGQSIVIDTGPDFRQQMIRERIARVDAILYTHEHKDHTAGMDDVRSFNFRHKMDMPIFARQQVLDQLKQEFSYVFAEKKYPGTPRVAPFPIENKPFQVNGATIIPIEVMHYRLPVFGFRLGDITYITDANHIAPEEIEKIKGSKIVVINALQKEDHISHFNFYQAIDLAREIGAEHTYLTHISHRLGRHQDIMDELPENISLAWDGLKVHL
ncbi:MAG: MBL fold metallo-hydrolase [Cyclobacteriaceae bacterium]|nr:MBL fold metallo-hydrolase [Cyclobacteriaceae bacterium]